MYPSTSSYRSSTSSSRRLRVTLRSQEHGPIDDNMDNRSRVKSQDYSASGKSASVSTSSLSSSSVTSSSEPMSPAQMSPATASETRKRRSVSKSPIMIVLRDLLLRCLTKRRKRRSRGLATRKMKNNNYLTRDDYGNIHGAGPRNSRGYGSIPTNEHEMFSMLHSRSKAKRVISAQLNAHPVSSFSSSSSTSTQLHQNRPRTTSREGAKAPVRSISPPLLLIEQRSEGESLLLS